MLDGFPVLLSKRVWLGFPEKRLFLNAALIAPLDCHRFLLTSLWAFLFPGREESGIRFCGSEVVRFCGLFLS